MKYLLKLWIHFKIKYAVKKGWINDLLPEKLFIANKTEKEIYNLKYKADMIGKILWDYQFDSIETFKRGGGDCNSINRCWQIYSALKFKTDNAYLVTYLHKPLSENEYYENLVKKTYKPSFLNGILNRFGLLMAHSGCIVKSGEVYFVIDYGQTIKADSYADAIKKLAEKYRCKVKCYVAQDLNFNFVNFGKVI